MKSPKQVFLLGAGGMGMAPLALYLQGAGIQVAAYDDHFKEPLRSQLEDAGVEVLGEAIPPQVPDCIIRSSAVAEDCPSLKSWHDRKTPIFRRGEFLARFTTGKKIMAVVGSHGKTTTAGMLAWGLDQVNFESSYLVGGVFEDEGMPCGKFARDSWLIMEIDESDGTIDEFSPQVTLALNCDWDHVDRYASPHSFSDTLQSLFSRTQDIVVLPKGSQIEEWTSTLAHAQVDTFSCPDDPADFLTFNAKAAVAAGHAMGADLSKVDFSKFPGMKRRQSVLHAGPNRTVIEDYAHHPAEIQSFLSHRRLIDPKSIMRVVFQPHRYSRTKALARHFADELALADDLFLLPTYPAFEKYDVEGAVETLAAYLPPRLREATKVFDNFPSLCESIGTQPSTANRDQVLFVGAGDLDRWAHALASLENANGDKFAAFLLYLTSRLSKSCVLRTQEPLAAKTTMKVGGNAYLYAEPSHVEDLHTLVNASKLLGIPYVMMGRGSNLIVPDAGYAGLVLRLRGTFWSEITLRAEDTLVVGAGARLQEICRFACQNQLKGFEFLEGIPGTLGGALRMNAGAMGWETFDLVEWVSFLLPDGSIREIPGTDLEVGYRYCKEAYEGIALRAKLKADGRSDHRAIRNVIDKLARQRRIAQPREASAGCIFRNPKDDSAGLLIDQAGLKGEREGAAVVSSMHANFIVNEGGASADEVISLIKRVRQRVKESKGKLLDPEVDVLGHNWNEFLS
ncbi:MAG: UDP-N-acetylmuramate dehydrogenase [Opitutales bacterium]|nr:UDP-N-acetylmuramate dehydrogenase [Opitutales bacterium]